jgi:hypothetical protein
MNPYLKKTARYLIILRTDNKWVIFQHFLYFMGFNAQIGDFEAGLYNSLDIRDYLEEIY